MKDEIRQSVAQWKQKADWKTVRILLDTEDAPKDVICFHCQQYIEKLSKAVLTANEEEFPKTHDLRRLLQLIVAYEPDVMQFMDQVDDLTIHGVQTRYPDFWMIFTDKQVKQTVELAEDIGGHLAVVLYRMGL